jgi:predicted type IV restriction endonuclease
MDTPKKVRDRLLEKVKKFQHIIADAKARDLNESDTSTIVQDMLSEVFGYEKYSDITTEHAVKCTYCDLAVKVDGKLKLLIELKAIGLQLKDQHTKQAVDYAANQGVDWVILSNAEIWQIYKVTFEKPIGCELIQEIDFSALDIKNEDQLYELYLLCKESWSKSALEECYEKIQIVNKYTIGAVLLSEDVVAAVRRILKKISSDVKVTDEAVSQIIENEIIKREVLEGDRAEKASKQVAKFYRKKNRQQKSDPSSGQQAA